MFTIAYMPHPIDIHVGQKLKQLRQARNMSQTTLAQAIGLTFQQIQKYETGRNRISASRLYELSKILDTGPAEFFSDIDKTN